IPQELMNSSGAVPWAALSGRLARRLTEETAVADDAARWAVDTWGAALGLRRTLSGTTSDTQRMLPSRTREDAGRPQRQKKGRRWLACLALLGVLFVAILGAAGAAAVLVGWFHPPGGTDTGQTADPEVQRDWDDAGRVMMTRGTSMPFYRERGPKRVEAWKR